MDKFVKVKVGAVEYAVPEHVAPHEAAKVIRDGLSVAGQLLNRSEQLADAVLTVRKWGGGPEVEAATLRAGWYRTVVGDMVKKSGITSSAMRQVIGKRRAGLDSADPWYLPPEPEPQPGDGDEGDKPKRQRIVRISKQGLANVLNGVSAHLEAGKATEESDLEGTRAALDRAQTACQRALAQVTAKIVEQGMRQAASGE